MQLLIVGLGNIGQRHLANLRLIAPDSIITVWHQHAKPGEAQPTPAANRVVYSLKDALNTQPDMALITGPASLHIETGLALAEQGVHIFLEKPLSHSLNGVEDLLKLCRQNALTCMVGYNYRFYKPLQIMRQALIDKQIGSILTFRSEVGQYLPDWRPDKDYRNTVSARSDLGGGVVLELSHELDYIRWLLGEIRSVGARLGHLSDLELEVEDTAEIILQLEGGAIGSIHMDMVQRTPVRYCRIIGSEGTLTWDGLSNHVQLFSSHSNTWTDLFLPQVLDRNDMYFAELIHFFDCVQEKCAPVCSGEDGLRVLQIALAAKKASTEQRIIDI